MDSIIHFLKHALGLCGEPHPSLLMGGAGIIGDPCILTVCCYKSSTNKAGVANTGGGGGGARYPGSSPFPEDKTGGNGGSGIVIVLECVAGSSAKSGIYSMAEQYVHAKRSSW